MPELTDEQLERVRRLTESSKEEVEEYTSDEWQQKADTGVYFTLGLKSLSHATYSLITETPETVRQSFNRSANAYVDGVIEARSGIEVTDLSSLMGAPIRLAKAVYTGVLSGSDDTLERVWKQTLSLPPQMDIPVEGYDETITFDADKYHFALALAAVAADAPDEAAEHAAQLREANADNEGVNELHFRAGIEFVEGMVARDPDLVEQGIRSMIDRHERQYDPQNVSDKIICLEATAFLVLARKRGLAVDVDSEFIPSDYVEWLLSSWGGD